MLSGDSDILEHTSDARKRMEEYADLFDELHIVTMASRYTPPFNRHNLFLYTAYARLAVVRRFVLYKKARALCRVHAFDVITVQSPDEVGIIGLILKWRFAVPLQVQVHYDVLSPWYRKSSWKERLRYSIAQFVLQRASCIRVVSWRIKKSLLESRWLSSHTPITVLPIFTDLHGFQEATVDQSVQKRFQDYQFKMVAAGRFVDREKNFSLLIMMMRDFVKTCPNVLLVLVGDGPDRRKYELEIRKYGLEKHVMLERWRDDLPSFFKVFDLFLLSSNHESWGRVVLEAMAAGLPVVMTDVGLAGEVVKNNENGVVVPVDDLEALDHAVRDLYEYPTRRDILATAGQKTARNLQGNMNDYLRKYKNSFLNCQ